MSETQPQLAPLVAAMASEMRAKARDRAQEWGPGAAVRALILTLLARILGRLEAMILAWQQGLLTPPKPRASTRRRDATVLRSNRARAPSWWQDSACATACTPIPSDAASPSTSVPLHPRRAGSVATSRPQAASRPKGH